MLGFEGQAGSGGMVTATHSVTAESIWQALRWDCLWGDLQNTVAQAAAGLEGCSESNAALLLTTPCVQALFTVAH
jgi:hypothetical protein